MSSTNAGSDIAVTDGSLDHRFWCEWIRRPDINDAGDASPGGAVPGALSHRTMDPTRLAPVAGNRHDPGPLPARLLGERDAQRDLCHRGRRVVQYHSEPRKAAGTSCSRAATTHAAVGESPEETLAAQYRAWGRASKDQGRLVEAKTAWLHALDLYTKLTAAHPGVRRSTSDGATARTIWPGFW